MEGVEYLAALSNRSHHDFIYVHIFGLLDREGNGTGEHASREPKATRWLG
jgi:hypothetical protein